MQHNFFQKVYAVVRQIPVGRVTSYGAIARYLGAPGAARMVGWALNQIQFELQDIPAHRVVNRNGLLTGKQAFRGQNTMQELLQSEGIKIKDNKVVHFKKHFWDPSFELQKSDNPFAVF